MHRFQRSSASGIAAAASHDDVVKDRIVLKAFVDPILIRPRRSEIKQVVQTAFIGRNDFGLILNIRSANVGNKAKNSRAECSPTKVCWT